MLNKLKRASVSGLSRNEKNGTPAAASEDSTRRDSTISIKSTSNIRSAARRLIGKNKVEIEDPEQGTDNIRGSLYFSLPEELQLQILLELPLPDLFSCRLSCRSFASLIGGNEAQIARHYTYTEFPAYCTEFYPNLPPHEYDIPYLYTMCHRYNASWHLSVTISEFIRVEIMRYSSNRARRDFQDSMALIQRTIAPLIFVLNHFYELLRTFVIRSVPGKIDAHHGEDLAQYFRALRIEGRRIMSTYYSLEMLVHAHRMHALLMAAFTRQMRPPTYMTSVERSVRGLGGRPTSLEAIYTVLAIGGVSTVNRILSISNFSYRKRAFKAFLNGLSSFSSTQWRENWLSLLLGPFPASQTTKNAFEPPEILQYEGFRRVWDIHAVSILAENDIQDPDGNWSSARAFISAILGYDILTRLTIPLHLQIPVYPFRATFDRNARYRYGSTAAFASEPRDDPHLFADEEPEAEAEAEDEDEVTSTQNEDRWWE